MVSETEEILTATAEALGRELTMHRLLHETVSGDGLIRSYEVHLSDADGHSSTEVLYLETAERSPDREGVLVFRNEETSDEVSVWLYPRDPALPALPTAVYPRSAAVIVQKMGIDPTGIDLSLVAYRPGKRAVVRVTTANTVLYMKVVRPHLIQELHDLYQRWRDAGLPVPATLGWTADGLIGFTALAGAAAVDVVTELEDEFLDSVDALLHQYAAIESTGQARTSLAARVGWYERRVTASHPDLRNRVRELTRRIESTMQSTVQPEPVTIHGDLHLGQLFVDAAQPNSITGVLDIDTAGLGDPADDAGAFYAHLVVSALFERVQGRGSADSQSSNRAEHFERLADAWQVRWRQRDLRDDRGFSHRNPGFSRDDPGLSRRDPDFAQRAEAIAATHLLAHALGGLVSADLLIARAEAVFSRHEKALM